MPNGIAAGGRESERQPRPRPGGLAEAPRDAAEWGKFHPRERECAGRNRSPPPAVRRAAFGEAALNDSHAPKSGHPADTVPLPPCKRTGWPRRMRPRRLGRISVARESCGTPATEFGWDSPHKIAWRCRLAARWQNIAPSVPIPEEWFGGLPRHPP